jgi:hypothetical protein
MCGVMMVFVSPPFEIFRQVMTPAVRVANAAAPTPERKMMDVIDISPFQNNQITKKLTNKPFDAFF